MWISTREHSLDVRYRSLPLLAEMADGLPFAPLIDETSSSYRLTTLATDLSPTASVRYSALLATDWRPTAGPHRLHAARNGYIVPLPHVRFEAAHSAIDTNANHPLA